VFLFVVHFTGSAAHGRHQQQAFSDKQQNNMALFPAFPIAGI
jgi:hypothetical protein